MGTRGITGFVNKGVVKAGYQQYDSYYSGVGLTVLGFARTQANTEVAIKALAPRVSALKVVDEGKTPTAAQIKVLARNGIEAADNVSTGMDWYAWLRSTQGDPAAILASGYIADSASFADESLFCEYGYLINLDDHTLEVFEGFQTELHDAGRFARDDRPADWTPQYKGDQWYYPIKLVAKFNLFDLPTDEEFIALLSPEEVPVP